MTEEQFTKAKEIKETLGKLDLFDYLNKKVYRDVKKGEYNQEEILQLISNHSVLIESTTHRKNEEFKEL